METTSDPAVRRRWRIHLLVAAGSVLAAVNVLLLLTNVMERKEEAKRHVFKIVDLTEETIDPAEWGKNYPRQYDSYKCTVDVQRTRHGPVWRFLFNGYAFSHAYMLSDQDMTERVKHFQQPGACLHCHSFVIPAYRKAGDGDVQKGFERICAEPYAEARARVSKPVSCIDCHHPESLQLRVSRPAFLAGLQALARSDDPVPHLPTFRAGERRDARAATTWHKGLRAERIEEHYTDISHADRTHPATGARMLKAQHPEFEFWSQGIHARGGVACADCHMPSLGKKRSKSATITSGRRC